VKRTKATTGRRKIALALAGGGAHSAFTWGALQFLLNDLKDHVEIMAVSGTSGGAMNAAVTTYALGVGAPDGERVARDMLDEFWLRTSQTADWYANPYRHVPNPLWWSWNIDGSPVPTLLSMSTSALGPAQLAPLHRNPLALVLESLLDFDRFAEPLPFPDLYVCATNVRTCQLTVFTRPEVSVDALCASACLPTADWPVVIGGEVFWDGGYRADPAISPLLESPRLNAATTGTGGASIDDEPVDVVLIGINPLIRDDLPLLAWQIMDRANEISLNSSIIDEMKRLMMMNDVLTDVDHLDAPSRRKVRALPALAGKRQVRVHYIESEREMAPLGVASKNNTALPFLEMLRDTGYRAAKRWWEDEGGAQDFANPQSRAWRTKIDRLFIDPHHWDAATVPAQREDVARASVATLAAETATTLGDTAPATR
jgi:NTE family protein